MALMIVMGAGQARMAGSLRPIHPTRAAVPAVARAIIGKPWHHPPFGRRGHMAAAFHYRGTIYGGGPRYGGAAVYGGAAAYGDAVVAQESAIDSKGPYTPVQIARSFFEADANHDGDLTRAEAAHLAIRPYSIEEMDLDHDGIITRFEYQDGVR